MVLSMKVSGIPRLNKDMVEDIKSGVMAAFTKVIGNATKPMVVED